MLNFRKTLHFRLTVFFILIFSISGIALLTFDFYITKDHLENQIRAHIKFNLTDLLVDYNQDGIDELRHDIQELIETDIPNRLLYRIDYPDGRFEFDNIPSISTPGWHYTSIAGQAHVLNVVMLNDGHKFSIATSLESVEALEAAFRQTILWSVAIIFLIGIVGGYLMSSVVLKKIDELKKHIQQFRDGNLKYRISISSNNNELDQISTALNSLFHRIEFHVSDVQRVTNNIAHDLRTPIGRLRQELEIMQHSPETPVQMQQKLESFVATTDQVLEIFSAMLRIAEIESGAQRANFKTVDLSRVIERIVSAYTAVIEDSDRVFIVNVQTTKPFQGDKTLIIQLISNLIENALTHTPPGTEITFGTLETPTHIEIFVADNGPGIPEIEIQNVLKPFYKLDKSRDKKLGAGLGLNLVSAIANLHGAEFIIESQKIGIKTILRIPKLKES